MKVFRNKKEALPWDDPAYGPGDGSVQIVRHPKYNLGDLAYYCDYSHDVLYQVKISEVFFEPTKGWRYCLEGLDGCFGSNELYSTLEGHRTFVVEFNENLTSYS